MKADFAFISDYAAERAGTVGAMGIGIDTLMAAQLPSTHPHIFLVIQLRCGAEERTLHDITIKAFHSDGDTLLNQQGTVNFSAVPTGTEGIARLVFGFYLLRFNRSGQHYFVVEEKGEVLAKIPLYVVQTGGGSSMPQPIPARGPSRRKGRT